jgi:hypothetical protein
MRVASESTNCNTNSVGTDNIQSRVPMRRCFAISRHQSDNLLDIGFRELASVWPSDLQLCSASDEQKREGTRGRRIDLTRIR